MRFYPSFYSSRVRNFPFLTILVATGMIICSNMGGANAQTTANYTFGGTSTISIPDPSTYITPDSNGVSETLNISAIGTVSSFNFITITGLDHSYMGDLTATLSHDGTTVDLFDHIGGTSTDYNNDPGKGFVLSSSNTYSFASSGSDYSAFQYHPAARTSPGFWDTVTSGTYMAQGNASGGADSANASQTLRGFNGQALSGNWTLSIYDNDPTNTGTFTGFNLNVTSSSLVSEPASLPYTSTVLLALLIYPRSRARRHRTCQVHAA